MANNKVQEGKTLLYSNTGSAISSGDVVVVGDLVGVATVDIAATTGTGTVDMSGVYELTKSTGTAIAQGEPVHYDTSATAMTGDPNGGIFAGVAWEAAGSSATTVKVKLGSAVHPVSRKLTAAADPATYTAGEFGVAITVIEATVAGTQTVNIPAAASVAPGSLLTVDKNGSAGAITLDPASGTIAGGSTHTALDADNDHATFQAIGTDWVLIASTIA